MWTLKRVKDILKGNKINYEILSIYHNKNEDYLYVVVDSKGFFKDKYKIYSDGSINPVDVGPDYMAEDSFEKIYCI